MGGNNPVRLIDGSDLPWALDLAKRRYPPFDEHGALHWALCTLADRERALMIRTDDAFLCGACGAPPWAPTARQFIVMFLCAEPRAIWQTVKLCRFSVAWAEERGAIWRIGADVPVDLGPIARSVGAVMDLPRYIRPTGYLQ